MGKNYTLDTSVWLNWYIKFKSRLKTKNYYFLLLIILSGSSGHVYGHEIKAIDKIEVTSKASSINGLVTSIDPNIGSNFDCSDFRFRDGYTAMDNMNCPNPDGSIWGNYGAIQGGVPPYTIAWSSIPEGLVPVNQINYTGDISPLVPGIYCATASDAVGCIISKCFTIGGVPCTPVCDAIVNFDDEQIQCGETITLTPTIVGATPPLSYSWANGLGNNASLQVQPNVTTTYSLSVTDSYGCTASGQVTVNIDPGFTVDLPSTITTCPNATSELVSTVNGVGPFTYLWSTGETTQNIFVSPGSSTTYTLTVTGSNGCSVAEDVVVNTSNTTGPTAEVTGTTDSSCSADNGSITVTFPNPSLTGIGLYISYDGGVTWPVYIYHTYNVTSHTRQNLPAGTYNIWIRKGNRDCETFVETVTILDTGMPSVDAGADQSICGNQSAILTATGDGPPFVWSTGETSQSITVNPTTTTSYTVTVSVNGCSASDEVTVSVCNSGSISGNVSEDIDNDDIGDVNLSGITIDLYNDINNNGVPNFGELVTNVLTDANGNYEFTGLPIGNYLVVENEGETGVLSTDSDYTDVLDGDADTTDPLDTEANNGSTTDDIIPVSLASGEEDIANNFVEEQLGSISGTVTIDTDNNDIGDMAQVNVTVTLTEDTNGNGVVDLGEPQTMMQTNGLGKYEFTGLEPGDYIVTTIDPSNASSVSDKDEEVDGDTGDSDLLVDNKVSVTLTPGEDDEANNFVDEVFGSISGYVSEDTDGDDEGNSGIGAVTINLIGSGPDGDITTTGDNVIVQSTTTSSDFTMPGFYEFTNVPPGDYIVSEVQPVNLVSVKDGDENDSDPLDNEVNNGSTTDDMIPVSLAAGEDDIRNDFVEEASASISGVVTEDLNNDDIGDVPLVGVTISLFNANNTLVGTTTTSDGTTDLDNDGNNEPAGSYYFGDLSAGDYTVVETDLSTDYRSVIDGDSTMPGDDAANGDTNDNMIPVSVNAGESDTGNDFVDEQISGSISGFVSEDTDGDGEGNVSIIGVTVNLIGAGPDGDITTVGDNVIVQSTVTSSDFTMPGFYEFTNVVPGDYIVMEVQPINMINVKDGDEDDSDPLDNEVNNGSTTDDMIPVSLSAGEDDIRNDFVEEASASISGVVTEDLNNDDIGDVPLVGVTISLFDANNTLVGTTTTSDGTTDLDNDGNNEPAGSYYFGDLSAGDYTVVETDLSTDYRSVVDGDSTMPGDDAANGDTNDNMIPVSVDAGESDSGNDFVDEQIPGSISGFVSEDTDGDGEGNVSITGVTINLIGAGPDGDITTVGDNVVVQSTTTVSIFTMPGFYEFTNVLPGDYIVMEVQPVNMSNVKDGDEDDSDPLDNEVNNGSTTDDLIPVSLAAGEDDIRNDFVEEAKMAITICGNIFYDTDLLEDNMVDGLPVIPSGINAVLVQVNGDMSEEVVGVVSVPGFGESMAGEFCFEGLSDTEYYVILTTSTVANGDMPPSMSTLPTDVFSTGENIGAGIGSDGEVNGTSANFVTTTVDVDEVNFGIIRFISVTVD